MLADEHPLRDLAMTTTKLILKSGLSPGDIVMLTAAVRDLHAAYPGEYVTDVRTPCAALWAHNPHITPIADADPEARVIEMHYPLIGRSNQAPFHFIHGYRMHLEKELGRPIPAGDFKGDIHLSAEERGWMSQVEEIEGKGTRFWIIVAGGKRDFTAKIWETARFQEVVDRLAGRIRFVQVGEAGHQHPALRGVFDLRGKTDLRQLVRLVHHADGVVCPVTSLMHLAAAVPAKTGALRPCVVIAGGREPSQWEAYPGHRFLDTIGSLPCCSIGGCWKSRVVAIGDGDKKDESLCVRPVATPSGQTIPQCLDLVTADAVVKAVESYLVVPVAEVKMLTPPAATKPCGTCGTGNPTVVTKDDPRSWGPGLWAQFHARADLPGLDLSKEPAWLAKLTKTVPCEDCRAHFTALLADSPPNLADPEGYFAWGVGIHNRVNERLGKPVITLEAALALREARLALGKRLALCRTCEHFSPPGTAAPRCNLANEPLKALAKDLARACPAGKWGAVKTTKPRRGHVGVVIGTYGALPYIHLQLESLRRFHPGMPCLVVDDGSPQREQLAALCREYGADFVGRFKRMGHVPGDMQAFIEGHAWAQKLGLGLLVKLSRRWVPIAPWLNEAERLWWTSRAPTLNASCTFHNYGFRSECVAMDVAAWQKADALKVVREHIAACANHPPDLDCGASGVLVEHIIHVAAKAAKDVAGWAGPLNYTLWPWMGTSRAGLIEGVLWHETSRASVYHATGAAWGLRYAAADYLDPKGNIKR